MLNDTQEYLYNNYSSSQGDAEHNWMLNIGA